jgi:hypothetical protein
MDISFEAIKIHKRLVRIYHTGLECKHDMKLYTHFKMGWTLDQMAENRKAYKCKDPAECNLKFHNKMETEYDSEAMFRRQKLRAQFTYWDTHSYPGRRIRIKLKGGRFNDRDEIAKARDKYAEELGVDKNDISVDLTVLH